jgi:hypothetical protein
VKIVSSRFWLTASDSANFLACRHLTRLDLLSAKGNPRPERWFDIGFQALVDRGSNLAVVASASSWLSASALWAASSGLSARWRVPRRERSPETELPSSTACRLRSNGTPAWGTGLGCRGLGAM